MHVSHIISFTEKCGDLDITLTMDSQTYTTKVMIFIIELYKLIVFFMNVN